jgi:ABC-type antimicrobial peptide transport system permease subunit
MLMVSIAASLALVLGAVGLYGVLSYRAARRAQEIGVRMALGAEAKTVRRMFMRQGAQVALIGVAVGALAAVGLTRYIQALLFDVGRFDFTAFAGMSAVMLLVALLASYVPAWRASRVNPVIALRAE